MTGALDGVTVLDISTLFAGPLAATMLGDFGADKVIKVEHPRGDPVRDHGVRQGRGPIVVEDALPEQTVHHAHDNRWKAKTCFFDWSNGPTCSSRTSARARWSVGISLRVDSSK